MKESFEKKAQYKINTLKGDDWEKLRDIRLRAVTESPQAFGDTVEKTKAQTEEVWRKWIANSHIYIIDDNNKSVSAATFRQDIDGVWEINAVWTDPSYRNKGLSRKIFEQIFFDAKMMSIDVIRLDVNSIQSAAVTLYESLGFKKIDSVPKQKMGDGNLHTREVMEIHL